jgi:ABC-type nickel/cobalt efflux system permease component RcnA
MLILKILSGVILIFVGIYLLVYACSRLQMRAWLHELDMQLGKRFIEKVNKLKLEKDEKSKK